MTPAEMSANLRLRAFEMPPFDAAAASDDPHGLISEFRQGDAVVTIAAFSTGDVSMYFSTGGGIIGGIGKPELAALARETIKSAAPLVPELARSEAIDPPGAGEYYFYLLTPSGRRVCRINASGTARADGPEVKLIRLSGALLTKIRETSGS
jgi:hypothetical protein